MENDTKNIYKSFGKYSVWLGIAGIAAYLMFFPSGIYYSFFCGVMAIATSVMARRGLGAAGSVAGIILGIIDILLGLMAFYALYVIYTSVHDPVAGPQITLIIENMLSQYGISLDTFVKMMTF